MKLYMKLGIASGIAFFFIIIFGFVAFPKLIKSKVKKMVVLTPGSDIREMFLKVPFPLEFRVYLFNVTNHMDVQKGELPRVQQVGPFCYEEWKEKVEVVDKDDEDVMFYKPKDTFLPIHWPGCLSGDETIIMPHPLILGMVNTVVRQKPNTLSLIGKAINSLYSNPDSIFVTAKARELIFEGVVINCGVKDFAGKAVCSELKSEATGLKRLSDDELLFSFLGPNNATAGKKHKVFRGAKVSHDVGRVIEYDDKKEMEVWPTKLCNKFLGTDGTIFPPYLTKQEGLASFSPALCRSLVATYVKNTNYDGMPVSEYTAGLGDQSKNADEKCYCPAPDNCLKKGLMDLYKCSGIPLYASLPHFLDSDESYVKGVVGLEPNKTIHSIVILFERQTGSPVFAKKRLQFSMPLERNAKIPIFKELPELILPLFWIEEGVALNNTYTKPIKDLFMVFKVMTALKWLVLLASLGGMGASGYLFYKKGGQMNITPVHKVQPSDGQNGVNGISTVMHGNSNSAMYGDESEKY